MAKLGQWLKTVWLLCVFYCEKGFSTRLSEQLLVHSKVC